MDELTQAADRGDTLEVRKLAAEGFGVNGAGGDGPLHLTAYNGHAETAKALELGACPSIARSSFTAAAHPLARQSQQAIFRLAGRWLLGQTR
jgi:hypothetical protein